MESFTVYQATSTGSKAFRIVYGNHVQPKTDTFGPYKTRVYQGTNREDCVAAALAGEVRKDIRECIKRFQTPENPGALKPVQSSAPSSVSPADARNSPATAANGGGTPPELRHFYRLSVDDHFRLTGETMIAVKSSSSSYYYAADESKTQMPMSNTVVRVVYLAPK